MALYKAKRTHKRVPGKMKPVQKKAKRQTKLKKLHSFLNTGEKFMKNLK